MLVNEYKPDKYTSAKQVPLVDIRGHWRSIWFHGAVCPITGVVPQREEPGNR